MSQRQYATPVIIREGKAAPLHRVEFDDDFHDEDWIQQLLFDHPELIPFEELVPEFKGSITVAREVESGAGPVDILCVNAHGLLTIVETKLWRNPQSRREVVSQLIHYAAEMAKMSYQDLADAAKEAAGMEGDPLMESLRKCGEKIDQQWFHDEVSRNLKRGRFLLLAIGDGIQEGVETMADYLLSQPQLGFTLRLVEMALFRLDPTKNDLLFVQPRIVARTQEVVRAIIELKGDKSDKLEVSTPPDPTQRRDKRPPITEAEFYKQLSDEVGPAEIAFIQGVLREAPMHHLTVEWRSAGPVLKYFDNEHDEFFNLGCFDRYGSLGCLMFFWKRCDELELPEEIWKDYFETLVRLIPGAFRKHGTNKNGWQWEDVWFTDEAEPVTALMAGKTDWWAAIDKAIGRIQKEMAKR